MGNYSLGFCHWDLPALLIVIAVLVVIMIHNHRHKKKVQQYRREIEEKECSGNREMDNTIK